jgi:ribose transport system substrate-binding protein
MRRLKFLVSLHSSDNDFQIAQAKAAEEAAHKLGIDAEIIFADNDAVNQSTQILKAIQNPVESRPDAIVLEPVSGTALPQVARAACSAGVGWAVLNRNPEYLRELRRATTAPIFTVTSDNVEIGRLQGNQFAALLPRGGAILYIEGPSQSSSAQKRTAGMLETKPSNIQIKTLKGKWTEESAERAICSYLNLATSQRSVIDLVGAQDDSMAMGARKAFQKITNEEERTRWLSLPFTGCDGQPTSGQIWVGKGWLAATVYIPPLAGTAIEILAKAIRERTRPPEHTVMASYSIPPLNVLAPRQS